MKEILNFLKDLRLNNNREWFTENKPRYLAVKSKVDELTSQFIARISEFDKGAAHLSVSDCTYRIYRDTRFRADKTPYKTHIGIYINPPAGKKSPRGGYYLHIEPGNCIIGGGVWCPEPKVLKAIRQDIFDNVDEYLEILNAPAYQKFYRGEAGEDLLKTAPKGFPKDWEYIDLIKPRHFTAECKLTDKEIQSKNMIDNVTEGFKAMKPLLDFLNYTVDEIYGNT